jgi:hypothetical protein
MALNGDWLLLESPALCHGHMLQYAGRSGMAAECCGVADYDPDSHLCCRQVLNFKKIID